jgi:hypothetical protein
MPAREGTSNIQHRELRYGAKRQGSQGTNGIGVEQQVTLFTALQGLDRGV